MRSSLQKSVQTPETSLHKGEKSAGWTVASSMYTSVPPVGAMPSTVSLANGKLSGMNSSKFSPGRTPTWIVPFGINSSLAPAMG